MGNSLCKTNNAIVFPDDDDTGVSVVKIKSLRVFWNDGHDSHMTTIAPMTDTDAWIANCFKSTVKLYSTANKEIRRKRVEGEGPFAMLSNGDHIVSGKRTLLRVASNGTVTNLIISTDTSKDLVPSGVFKTQTDDILVSLTNDDFLSQVMPTSRRLLQRMAISGDTLQPRETYEFREDGTTKLFNYPHFAMENANSDICVSDISNVRPPSGNLIVLRKIDGQIRFIYNQNRPGSKFNFFPGGLTCDSESRIIVGDFFVELSSPFESGWTSPQIHRDRISKSPKCYCLTWKHSMDRPKSWKSGSVYVQNKVILLY